MEHLTGSFSITDIIRKTACWRSAAILAAAAIAGALLGGVVVVFHQPVYEAQVVLAVDIDLSHSGQLTDIEEDHALGVIDSLISSTQVYEKIVVSALDDGIDTGLHDLESRLEAERLFREWSLRVRHEDPVMAARLAELWGQSAQEMLRDAGQQARKVDASYRRDDHLENCFGGSPVQPAHAICETEVQEMIEGNSISEIDFVHQSKQASLGVLSGMAFEISNEAQVSSRPVHYDPLKVVLGGIVSMVILAAAVLFFRAVMESTDE